MHQSNFIATVWFILHGCRVRNGRGGVFHSAAFDSRLIELCSGIVLLLRIY